MSDRKPLVLAQGPGEAVGQLVLQQLQAGDDLDIPIERRVARLELVLQELVGSFVAQGWDVPEIALSVLEDQQ